MNNNPLNLHQKKRCKILEHPAASKLTFSKLVNTWEYGSVQRKVLQRYRHLNLTESLLTENRVSKPAVNLSRLHSSLLAVPLIPQ